MDLRKERRRIDESTPSFPDDGFHLVPIGILIWIKVKWSQLLSSHLDSPAAPEREKKESLCWRNIWQLQHDWCLWLPEAAAVTWPQVSAAQLWRAVAAMFALGNRWKVQSEVTWLAEGSDWSVFSAPPPMTSQLLLWLMGCSAAERWGTTTKTNHVWAEFKGTWITLLPWKQQGSVWLVTADCGNLCFWRILRGSGSFVVWRCWRCLEFFSVFRENKESLCWERAMIWKLSWWKHLPQPSLVHHRSCSAPVRSSSTHQE